MTNNIDELISGVGIVIDDAFGNDKDKMDDIFKIIKQIKDKNIPLIEYNKLPDKAISHFKNVSFILLDWNLSPIVSSPTEGVTTPHELEESKINENIEFIKNIKEECFIPLFIFTKENIDEIINKLVEADLYTKEKPNFIFVENKSEIKNEGTLFLKIAEWLKDTTSVYVLKEWEITLNHAKNELFWDFYDLNPDWPKILWSTYKEDQVDMAAELGELITRNLKSRMSNFNFNKEILNEGDSNIKREDIISVITGDIFITNSKLNEKEINTGDIYKDDGGKYLLNIRPQCDLFPRCDNEVVDSITVYLIKGECIPFSESKKVFNKKCGNFKEKINEAILFPVEKSIIKFSFKNQINKSYGELKGKRIGKILPPYITRIQQRYALYLQREGVPRTPKEAILENSDN